MAVHPWVADARTIEALAKVLGEEIDHQSYRGAHATVKEIARSAGQLLIKLGALAELDTINANSAAEVDRALRAAK